MLPEADLQKIESEHLIYGFNVLTLLVPNNPHFRQRCGQFNVSCTNIWTTPNLEES